MTGSMTSTTCEERHTIAGMTGFRDFAKLLVVGVTGRPTAMNRPTSTTKRCALSLMWMITSRAIQVVQTFHQPLKYSSRHLSKQSFLQLSQPLLRHCHLQMSSPTVSISDTFDGGNAEFVGTSEQDGSLIVSLNIKPDPYTELEKTHHFQYFAFRSTVSKLEKSKPLLTKYVVENASSVSYPVAWEGSTVFYSQSLNDPDSWRRKLDTSYQNGKLSWTHVHESNGSVYFAYFPPYSYSRHLDLVSKCSAYANVESLGKTLDGHEIDYISFGQGSRSCWIIHRQHPGETMAEYYAEGLLNRLLGLDSRGEVDGLVKQVLSMYTFHIVPCMCLDGAVRGHLRTNACGANLNREWTDTSVEGVQVYHAPTLERSPEVYHVLRKMEETGVDVFLDIHGDEELPFNFIAGAEGVPNWDDRLKGLHGAFLAAYVRANSDMQEGVGYNPVPAMQGTINKATEKVAHRFNCLAMTLEMPFKDCLSNSDPERGWSPHRSRLLGASVLAPLSYVHRYLRDDGEFWKTLPPEDAYVTPSTNFKK